METGIFRLAMVLDDLEKAQGTNAKKKILAQWVGPEDKYKLNKLFQYALSSYYTFGITTWAGHTPQKEIPNPKEAIWEVLESLINRKLTGHAARDILGTLAEDLDTQMNMERLYTGDVKPSEALRRVVTKDLRCGIGAKNINAVVPGLIPVFEVQLAPSEQIDLNKTKFPLAIEPKYDGMRLPAIPNGGSFQFFSRDGALMENFEELEELFKMLCPEGFVFDGEVVDKVSSFSNLIGRAKSQRGTKTEKATLLSYIAFDMLTIDEWERKVPCPPYEVRRQRLIETLNNQILFDIQEEAQEVLSGKYNGRRPSLSIAPMTMVNTKEEFDTITEDYLKITPEGIIAKDPKGLYEFDRTKTWQKYKPMLEGDGQIYDVDEEGTGKNKGLLKNIFIRGGFLDPRRGFTSPTLATAKIGSGFSDDLRRHITELHRAGKLIGMVVELQYQEISQSKEGKEKGTYSLRFPTLRRFRGLEPGEKL
jgi:ATP-dependent DNA ligase